MVIELTRLAAERADVREELGERFPHLVVDELEEAGMAHRGLLAALTPHDQIAAAIDEAAALRRYRGAATATVEAMRRRYPELTEIELDEPVRAPELIDRVSHAITDARPDEPIADPATNPGEEGIVGFWRCRTERAMAQAAAHEIERRLHSGELRPEDACVVVGSLQRDGRLVAAALEERSVPFRLAGSSAFF